MRQSFNLYRYISELPSATFGHNNEDSWAKYSNLSNVKTELASNLEISVFFRTRGSDGVIFYIGTDLPSTLLTTSFQVELRGGKIVASHSLCPAFTSIQSSQMYNDGQLHFLTARLDSVNITLIIDSVKTSSSRAFAHPCEFKADVLYVGGLPNPVSKRRKRTLPTTFQGVIQDFRLANAFVVIPPNNATNLPGTTLEAAAMVGVLAGIQTSDVCNLTNPCQNATSCENVVFNDY